MKPSPVHLIFILAITITGCNKYYMPVKSTQSPLETIKASMAEGRYFILRDSAFAYGMEKIELDENESTITCDLVSLPKAHMKYTSASAPRNYFFKYDQPDSIVLREVHLFTRHHIPAEINTRSEIPLSLLDKIEVIRHDKRKTNKQNLLVGLGVTAGIATLVAIIASAETISDLGDWGNY